MVAFTKINDFTEDLGNEIHNLGADSLQLALSNTAPASEGSNPTADGNGVVANVTQIAYTNVGGGQPTLASGVATLDAADEIILASGGAVPTFRYVYLFNNTAAAKNIIGLWDAGAAIDLADGEQTTVTFNAAGILTAT